MTSCEAVAGPMTSREAAAESETSCAAARGLASACEMKNEYDILLLSVSLSEKEGGRQGGSRY